MSFLSTKNDFYNKINNFITTNGSEAITGAVMNDILQDIKDNFAFHGWHLQGNLDGSSGVVTDDEDATTYNLPAPSLAQLGVGYYVHVTGGGYNSGDVIVCIKLASSYVYHVIGGGDGSVSNVSIVTANGFAGTVHLGSTTPQITLTTTVTGLVVGDGTGFDAATTLDVTDALGYTPEDFARRGAANGYAPLNGASVVPISYGGTGAATANGALNHLLPSQAGITNGWALVTDGTDTRWADVTPSLSGYATESWVTGLGYATEVWVTNQNYLTSFTETDPIFTSHTVYNIANGTGYLKNDGSGTWTYDNSLVSSQWITSGSDIYYSAGKVGIGTSTPQGILEVNDGSAGLRLDNTNKIFRGYLNGGDDGFYFYGDGAYNTHYYSVYVGDNSSYQQTYNSFGFYGGSILANGLGSTAGNYQLTWNSGTNEITYTNSGITGFSFLDNNGIDVDSGANTLNIGAGYATVINYGNSGTVHNFFGIRNTITTTDTEIQDKLITLNKGGGSSTGFSTGFEIEVGGVSNGWFMTSSDDSGFDFKTNSSTNQASLKITDLTHDSVFQLQDIRTTIGVNSAYIAMLGNNLSLFNNDLGNYGGWITASSSEILTNKGGSNLMWTNDAGYLLSSGSYSNPSWITSLAWSKISGTPTTLAGYGITDAYTKTSSDARYLQLSGGTMTGVIDMGSYKITSTYVPVNAADLVNKAFFDNYLTGVIWTNVDCVATSNITLSGEQTIDGVTTSSSRVLVTGNSTASTNGLYISSSGSWTRATDADTGAEILKLAIIAQQGTTYGHTQWFNTNTSISLGSTSITFTQVSGVGTYTNGSGISLSGNVFSLNSSYFSGDVSMSGGVMTNTGLKGVAVPTLSAGFLKYTGSAWTYDSSTYLTSVTAHNLLSSTHGDTLADTVVRGDLMIGNSTPKWSRLAKGTATYVLTSDGTDINWAAPSAGRISALTAANATNTLANGTNTQTWNWDLTSTNNGIVIGETSANNTGTGYLMAITGKASTTSPTVNLFKVAAKAGTMINAQALGYLNMVGYGGSGLSTDVEVASLKNSDGTGIIIYPATSSTAPSKGGIKLNAAGTIYLTPTTGVNFTGLSGYGLNQTYAGSLTTDTIAYQAVSQSTSGTNGFTGYYYDTGTANFTSGAGGNTGFYARIRRAGGGSTMYGFYAVGTSTSNPQVGMYISVSGSSAGNYALQVAAGLSGFGITAPTAQVHIVNATASVQGLIVKAAASQTANISEWQDNSANILSYINKQGDNGVVHLIGTSSIWAATSIAAGAGAGTSPTVSISGTDLGGVVTVTSGTLPTLSAVIATITFGKAYLVAPKSIILTAANSNASTLSGVSMVFIDSAGITTTTFAITAGATALTAATTYKWYYQVIQ